MEAGLVMRAANITPQPRPTPSVLPMRRWSASNKRPIAKRCKAIKTAPTLFINGQKIDGAVPISEVRAALDAALRDAGQPVPTHLPSAPTPASK